MESFITAVAQVGFPITVAGYLLLRQEKTLKELSDKIESRLDAIDKSLGGELGTNVKIKELTNEVSALRREIAKK